MLLLTLLIFLSSTMLLAGLYLWLAPSRLQQRLQTLGGPLDKPGWTETLVKVSGPLARLSAPDGKWDESPLRLRFLHAGVRREDARSIYFAAKTLLPLLLAGLAFFMLQTLMPRQGLTLLLNVMVAALLGCYLPNILLALAVRSRQREIFENFPDAADLMLVCVEAGLGLDLALSRVADEIRRKSVALAEELHLTNLEMRAGAAREKALRNLAMRTGVEEVGTFATMLTQADKFGTSIGDSLRVFSDDLRHKRQTRAEEQAAKIPTKMLIPLVLCIFPVVSLVILSPAVIRMIRQMMPMLSGGG
jgi:tight adherence protein C